MNEMKRFVTLEMSAFETLETAAELKVYAMLCYVYQNRQNGGDGVEMSFSALIEKVNMDKKTVFRAVTELENKNLIQILRKPGKINHYSVMTIDDDSGYLDMKRGRKKSRKKMC
jgi:DNA-binding MarR family transcriptional regulator